MAPFTHLKERDARTAVSGFAESLTFQGQLQAHRRPVVVALRTSELRMSSRVRQDTHETDLGGESCVAK